MSNSLQLIAPYRYKGKWVFDDTDRGLLREPFVGGMTELMDEMVKDVPHAEDGFCLFFSEDPFPMYDYILEWKREELNGNWYYSDDFNLEGWLCPALLKYFDVAPAELYIKCAELVVKK